MPDIKSFSVDIKALDDGEFEAILSVPTVDRDGEIIDAGAFEPLPLHIPIDIDHGMSVTTTVGSGEPFYDGDVLMFRGAFASTPLAQEVRTLVLEGHVRKMSVAYMGSQYEDDAEDGRPHLRKAELLNAAIVAIPSNREADILAAKAFEVEATRAKDVTLTELLRWELDLGGTKAGARNSTKDSERLQAIHDLAVQNGAVCKHEDAEDEVSTDTDPDEEAAAPKAAADSPADVNVGKARRELLAAEAALALLP